ncbi:MAG: hypothetical protein E7368_00520 [Clostridiales bacterium]|nr:hypothetical protein [Clostridiales bacterium]
MSKKQRPDKKYTIPNPKKKHLLWKVLSVFIRIKAKRPEIINLAGEELEDKSIIVANHSAKSGPPAFDVYFPKKTAKWGAHEMLGYYSQRKAYLRDVLNIKKLKKKPGLWNSFKSAVVGLLNPIPYGGMWMVPTFPDGRLIKTLRYSTELLDKDIPIMVFPENSNDGYKTVLTEFFPGFIILAEKYYRANGIDLPIYPTYYHLKKRIMVIGKPMYVQDMVKEGLTREEIAKRYLDAVNNLYYDYVQGKRFNGKAIEEVEEK